jgi:hypothetical protein
MDAITGISQLSEGSGRDKFIPVRKEDLFSALIKQGDFADTAERELFRRFARTLRTICHYEYSETLDPLREDYYYFSPEVAGLASSDRAKSDCAYDDLIRSLDKVLKDANFAELPHEDVAVAYRKRTVPIEVKAEHDDFREVRFYKRGRHIEELEVSEWFGLRRRKVKIEVFDDIVLLVAMKTLAEIGSRRELRILKRRKVVPGSVLLKYFRNIACGDLYALFPNARVVMSNFDKAFLGVPAIAGGIPILLKLYATISVLFVAGIFDYLIATAEDQETKEAALAYRFISKAGTAPTAAEIAVSIETWLAKNFGVRVDFGITNALETLNRFRLVRREGERLFVPPLEAAIAQLHEVWNNFFRRE